MSEKVKVEYPKGLKVALAQNKEDPQSRYAYIDVFVEGKTRRFVMSVDQLASVGDAIDKVVYQHAKMDADEGYVIVDN